MRWAANTAIAVAPTVISASHLKSTGHGMVCGGRSEIGMSSHPSVPMGIETMSGALQCFARDGNGEVHPPCRKLGAQPRRGILVDMPGRGLRNRSEGARVLLGDAREHLHLIRHRLDRSLRRPRPKQGEHHPGEDANHRHDRHDEEQGDLGA